MNSTRTAAVVDAYSTGQYLASELRKHGFSCIHVQSTQVIPEIGAASFRPGDFVASVAHDGDVDATARALSARGVELLMIGCELGVELGDALAARMRLACNAPALSRARRDKFEMGEALRRAGVPVARQLRSARQDDVEAWASALGRWPVVLKPVDSSGSDNVMFCRGQAEVAAAFQRITSSRSVTGRQNRDVLAQEFLEGTEYFVNTVSAEGRHHVAEIWQYHKRTVPGAGSIYDWEEPLPFEGEPQAALRGYVVRVLDALGVRVGPAHSEIMMTARGPILLETGARLAGSIIPAAVSACMQRNQVELAVESYVRPAELLRRVGVPYRMTKRLRYVSLIVPRDGVLRSVDRLDEIRRLPSFFDMCLYARPGARLRKTVDAFTSSGHVYLIHEDPEVLRRDYEAIRALELSGLYELD
ncbi:ATP-grasp domain-containing protein [Sorangium cellulosum]|uniref:ATP-grasp domain-containing protein n=1 Tax=Sorangium cellulosum TaxID=56 RepID=A0A150R017_SORCE|nr:ATP-grasp domain-containing protein [Sorangium cellulosum]KYF73563.1 hypothetical protein BE15_27130 [Sorangium cellulosum]